MEKISVLLIDDEQLVLDVLLSLIDWDNSPYYVCGTARNDEEANQVNKKEHPQIIMTDVFMPGRDGLSIVEQLKKDNKEAEIIILSSYENFAFVRKAMQIGAGNYLLKNELSELTLSNVLDEAASKYMVKKNQNEALISRKIREFFEGKREYGRELFDFVHKRYFLLSLFPFQNLREISMSLEKVEWEKIMKNESERIPEEINVISFFDMGIQKRCFILEIKNSDAVNQKRVLEELKIWLTKNNENYGNEYAVILSAPSSDVGSLQSSWKRIQQCVNYLPFLKRKEVNELEKISVHLRENDIKNLMHEECLENTYQKLREEQVKEYVHRIFCKCQKGFWSRKEAVHMCQRFFKIVEYGRKEYAIPSWLYQKTDLVPIYTLEECEKYFLRELYVVKKYEISNYQDYTQKALVVIRKRFQENINAAEVAATVGISESHLRAVMRKDTGEGVNGHLQWVRLDVAKWLVYKEGYSIQKAAEIVGYANPSYLYKLLKAEKRE